jgi:molecular chaperone DnaK (HSP70)
MVHYEIAAEGLPEPFRGQFQLVEKKAATLEIESQEAEFAKEIIPAVDDEIGFKFTNVGEDTLNIKSIEIIPASTTSDIQMHPGIFPPALPPGRSATVKVLISVGLQPPPGDHWFELVVDCNDADSEHCRRKFPVKVVDEVYRDFVAIDFGTTDSAIARFNPANGIPESLTLEPGSPDEVKVYSNIFFKGYSDGDVIPSIWTIGQVAKTLGANFRERFVKAIKTKAGQRHIEKVYFKDGKTFDLKAEDIIELIMMQLLKLSNISLRRRPLKVILSVPTRFTLRQKEILQEALKKAANSRKWFLDIAIIDESLAAGLFFILRRAPKDARVRTKQCYTLMILDFGGGTTDVTVFKVQQHLDPHNDLKIDEIEIIGAWGDATLGGEEITTEIATVLASRFLDRAVNPKNDLVAIRKLEDEAEAIKIIVSVIQGFSTEVRANADLMTAAASPLLRANVAYVIDRISETIDSAELRDYLADYLKNDRELDVSSTDFGSRAVRIKEDEVVQIFDRKLQKLKKELQALLSRILSNSDNKSASSSAEPRVDVMLLAGQSAQFPTVARLFQDLAHQPIDFVRDSRGAAVLKECVSRGALYYSYHLTGEVRLNITGLDKRWTRIGKIVGFGFQELIKWGHRYPCDSEDFVQAISRTSTGGYALEVDISENLSMDDSEDEPTLKRYKSFGRQLENGSTTHYTCKLGVDDGGEIHAYCKIHDEWVAMKPL